MDPSKTTPRMGVIADSSFPMCSDLSGRIVTPLEKGDLERASSKCHAGLMEMSAAITAIKQAAEWGMESTSKCFRRLLIPLLFSPKVRGRRIENIYRLYNLRVRRTGISQTRKSFFSYDHLFVFLFFYFFIWDVFFLFIFIFFFSFFPPAQRMFCVISCSSLPTPRALPSAYIHTKKRRKPFGGSGGAP